MRYTGQTEVSLTKSGKKKNYDDRGVNAGEDGTHAPRIWEQG